MNTEFSVFWLLVVWHLYACTCSVRALMELQYSMDLGNSHTFPPFIISSNLRFLNESSKYLPRCKTYDLQLLIILFWDNRTRLKKIQLNVVTSVQTIYCCRDRENDKLFKYLWKMRRFLIIWRSRKNFNSNEPVYIL